MSLMDYIAVIFFWENKNIHTLQFILKRSFSFQQLKGAIWLFCGKNIQFFYSKFFLIKIINKIINRTLCIWKDVRIFRFPFIIFFFEFLYQLIQPQKSVQQECKVVNHCLTGMFCCPCVAVCTRHNLRRQVGKKKDLFIKTKIQKKRNWRRIYT